MSYYRPIKVIASTSGRPGKDGTGGAIVITSDDAPTIREDGSPLVEGDFWWDSTEEILNIYIDGAWQVAGGQGILNTSELPLTSPTTTEFGTSGVTLPDSSNLATQEDANLWFFAAIQDLDSRIEAGGGGGGSDTDLGKLDFIGHDPIKNPNNPIYTAQITDQVTHYFKIDELVELESAIRFNVERKERSRLRNRSLLKETDVGQMFDTTAPMTVSVSGNDVLHGMLISDCNSITNTKVHRNASFLNSNAEVDGFTFVAESPVTVDVQDDTIIHGFLISDLNVLT